MAQRKKLRNWLLGLASLMAVGMGPAHAVPIELGLVVDASGSINNTEWETQMQGYAGAISSVLPIDGSVAVSVTRFARSASLVRSMTTISSAGDRDALANFFWDFGNNTGLNQSGNGGLTCISCGIETAHASLTGTATRSLIDVSTDGSWNRGVDPDGPAGTTGTAEWAVANNADAVNALGIGTGTPPDFNHGTDSFSLLAPGFAEFQSTLETKLRREVVTVPGPATLLLFGLGLGLIALVAGGLRRGRGTGMDTGARLAAA